jgi:hypothetical protein
VLDAGEGERHAWYVIGAGVIIALDGLLLIWLSVRMRQERLPADFL